MGQTNFTTTNIVKKKKNKQQTVPKPNQKYRKHELYKKFSSFQFSHLFKKSINYCQTSKDLKTFSIETREYSLKRFESDKRCSRILPPLLLHFYFNQT